MWPNCSLKFLEDHWNWKRIHFWFCCANHVHVLLNTHKTIVLIAISQCFFVDSCLQRPRRKKWQWKPNPLNPQSPSLPRLASRRTRPSRKRRQTRARLLPASQVSRQLWFISKVFLSFLLQKGSLFSLNTSSGLIQIILFVFVFFTHRIGILGNVASQHKWFVL